MCARAPPPRRIRRKSATWHFFCVAALKSIEVDWARSAWRQRHADTSIVPTLRGPRGWGWGDFNFFQLFFMFWWVVTPILAFYLKMSTGVPIDRISHQSGKSAVIFLLLI